MRASRSAKNTAAFSSCKRVLRHFAEKVASSCLVDLWGAFTTWLAAVPHIAAVDPTGGFFAFAVIAFVFCASLGEAAEAEVEALASVKETDSALGADGLPDSVCLDRDSLWVLLDIVGSKYSLAEKIERLLVWLVNVLTRQHSDTIVVRAELAFYDKKRDALKVGYFNGFTRSIFAREYRENSHAGRAYAIKKMLHSPDVSIEPWFHVYNDAVDREVPKAGEMVSSPITSRRQGLDQPLAVLSVTVTSSWRLTPDDLVIVSILSDVLGSLLTQKPKRRKAA